MPELKFYLSESFSSVTPVPFDGANLNCAEGRLNIHELGENALSAKRLIFGPRQNGIRGSRKCQREQSERRIFGTLFRAGP